MFLILLAAAQLSAPTGTGLLGLFRADDVPLQMLGDEADRTVGIRLVVRPDGHVQGCEVEYSSGLSQLDAYTCRLAAQRARFAPASTQKGTPAYAVYRAPIRYVVTNGVRPLGQPRSDFTLTLNQLPPGVKSPVDVHVMFEVDERGHASACGPADFHGKLHADPQLVGLACDQLLKNYTAIPAKDQAGNPVPSVQDADVRVTTK